MTAPDFAAILRDHADWNYTDGMIATPACYCGTALAPADDTFAAENEAHHTHVAAVLQAAVREALTSDAVTEKLRESLFPDAHPMQFASIRRDLRKMLAALAALVGVEQ